MYRFWFLTLIIIGQVLAEPLVHGIVRQSIDQDISAETIIENVTGQLTTNLMREVKPLNQKEPPSNIDLYWQSLLQDLNGEPIAQDMAGRRIYKNKRPQSVAQNNTEQSMHKNVPLVLKVPEHLSIEDVASQQVIHNITGKPLAPNITEQSMHKDVPSVVKVTEHLSIEDVASQQVVQNITVKPLAPNITEQSMHKDVPPVVKVTEHLSIEDVVSQQVVQNITVKPVAPNITEQSMHKDVPPVVKVTEHLSIEDVESQQVVQNITGKPLASNITEQSMHKDVPPVLKVTEHLSIEDVASQRVVQNITGKPLAPNKTEQSQDPNESGPSQAQSDSTQQDTIQDDYPNVTHSAGSFGQSPDHKYHSPYLDPYKDSNYKSSMPPIQTQEQWNATNWHEEEGLTDEEVRQADEFRQQEKRYRKMQEEINNTTTSCEEFLNNTVFDPEKVLNKDWHTIYYWNLRDEDPYNMMFTRATETMIKRFKDELDREIRPPVDWSAAELFLETNVEYNALYVKTNVSGLYRAIPSASFQYFGVPILNYALKIVNDEYLGIVNCKAKQCYALSDMEKLPQIEQIPKIAKSMGFHCLLNNSFVHTMSFDDKDPDDRDESSEDIFMDYDTLNTDPLQIDIF